MTTTYTITSGYDAYTDSASGRGSINYGSASTVKVAPPATPTQSGYIYLPLPPDVIGSTVTSATLSGTAVAAYSGQTVTVSLVRDPWAESTITWFNIPGAVGSQTTVLSSGAAGSQVVVNATSAVTTAASGLSWYGLLLNSTGTLAFNSFESSATSWVLTIVTSDAPETPQALVPNGTVVASGAPVLTCDFTDNGGLTNDMAAMNVQVNATNVWTSPTYDQTGTTTTPIFDLSSPPTGATAFTPVTSGTTRWWRVRVQDSDGNWSGWSNGASWTFRTQVGITVNNPAAGVVYDPTFVVTATTSATMSAYRVQITDGTDRSSIRFDSGRQASSGTSISVPIPEYWGGILPGLGTRVLVDGSNYQLHIQAWDTFSTRQSTPGSPSYAESWTTFTFADDAGVTKPTTLSTSQPTRGPGVLLTWTRASTPDGWVILRKGPSDSTPKVINRTDGSDVGQAGTTYTWIDTHPQPWVPQVYTVKAITNVLSIPHQSQPSPTSTISPQGLGVWIYTQSGGHVCLDGNAVDQLTVNDRRTSYKPVNLAHDVDIVTGLEGISGTFTGTFPSDIDPSQSLTDVQAILLAIRAQPQQWVRLVYGTFSGKVLLRNVAVLPSPLGSSATPLMQVSFGVNQVGDFEQVRN